MRSLVGCVTFLYCMKALTALTVILSAPQSSSLRSQVVSALALHTVNCSDITTLPVIIVNSVSDFSSIYLERAHFNSTQLVALQLTATDRGNQVAYDFGTQSPFLVNHSLACTALVGAGAEVTTMLVNSNISGISVVSVTDFLMVDVRIDRYDSAYNSLLDTCMRAWWYNSTGATATSSLCQEMLNAAWFSSAPEPNAIWIYNSQRVGFIRAATSGGVTIVSVGFSAQLNTTIASSTITSMSSGVAVFGTSVNGLTYDGVYIYNNTISAIWYNGVYSHQESGMIVRHNYVYDTGDSAFSAGLSDLQLYEYNYARNFSYLPGASGQGAGFYNWNGAGWNTWGIVFRNNFFWSPSQKCFYLDDQTSNVVWELNICVTAQNELNGGRFNTIVNNLMLALGEPGYRSSVVSINCRALSYITSPMQYRTCPYTVTSGSPGDSGFLTSVVWANYYANGTLKNQTAPPYSGIYTDIAPQFAHPIWCTDTAGPNNTACSFSGNWTFNGTKYYMDCATLPSQNKVGFVVVYNSSGNPTQAPGAGYGCSCPGLGCGLTVNKTEAFPGNYTGFNVIPIVTSVNYLNSSMYDWPVYNQSNVTALFGSAIRFDLPEWDTTRLVPSNLSITIESILGQQHPALLAIDFQRIGLDFSSSSLSSSSSPLSTSSTSHSSTSISSTTYTTSTSTYSSTSPYSSTSTSTYSSTSTSPSTSPSSTSSTSTFSTGASISSVPQMYASKAMATAVCIMFFLVVYSG